MVSRYAFNMMERVKIDLRYTSFDFSGRGRNPIFMVDKEKKTLQQNEIKNCSPRTSNVSHTSHKYHRVSFKSARIPVCCIAKFWPVRLCQKCVNVFFDQHRYKCNSFGNIKNKGLWESSCVWDIMLQTCQTNKTFVWTKNNKTHTQNYHKRAVFALNQTVQFFVSWVSYRLDQLAYYYHSTFYGIKLYMKINIKT